MSAAPAPEKSEPPSPVAKKAKVDSPTALSESRCSGRGAAPTVVSSELSKAAADDATLDGVLLELMKRYQESAGPDHRWTEEGIERFVDSLLGEEDASSSAEFHQLSYASLDEHVDTELGAMVREITLCHICGFNAEHCVCNHD